MSEWFRRIRHLPFVPDALRLSFARDLLQGRPFSTAVEECKLSSFARYFESYWLENASIRDTWGQYGNTGPRTTNYVEGWHNSLHSRLPNRHPTLAEFIQWLQVSQHATQNRIQALLHDSMAVARQPSQEILRRNTQLASEMAMFGSWLESYQATFSDVVRYLDRVADIGILPSQV